MKVLIIEDEPLAADHLQMMLGKYDSNITILGRCDSIKSSVEWFESNKEVDLIFMDIQLADGLSFDIFNRTEVPASVIFTTAFDEYAIKAFKVNSIDYLLKPIDIEGLSSAIDKFKSLYPTQQKSLDNENLLMDKLMQMISDDYKSRFMIKVGEHIRSIKVEEMAYFYTMDRACFVHLFTGKEYAVDYSLDQLEMLLNPKHFFRINRKYIVNIESINDIISYSNSRLKLKLAGCNHDDIIVSREKVKSFKSWLDR